MPHPAAASPVPLPLSGESTPREIAPFLKSLRAMLDHESDAVLRWTPDGRAFEIRDVATLTKMVLPVYFKHAKYASFQRQLNYFHFRKWTKSRTEVCTFANPHFQRDEPHLSWRILRKRSLGESSTSTSASASASTCSASASSPLLLASVAPVVAGSPSASSTSHSSGSVSDDSVSLCDSPQSSRELDATLDWIDAVFPSLEMLYALGQDDNSIRRHYQPKFKAMARSASGPRRDAPMPARSIEYVTW